MAKPKNLSNDIIASRFLQEHPSKPSINLLLIKDQETFYSFNPTLGIWAPICDKDFTETIYSFVRDLKNHSDEPLSDSFKITFNQIKDLTQHIYFQAPITTPTLSSHFVTLSDQHSINLATPPFTPIPSTRSQHAIYHLPFPSSHLLPDADPSHALPQRFLSFLYQILITPDTKLPDLTLIDYVQEMFGYCLTSSTASGHAFFLYGTGANGKSVLLEILRALFPSQVLSSSTLQSLTTNRFALANLRSKRLNITNEEESKHIRSDIFKNLITGEPVTAEMKFRDAFEFKANVKFLFATNKLPKFDGVEYAIARRLQIIPFLARIPLAEQDPFLAKTIIKEELPQIALWALKGAERLIKNNYKFSQPEALLDTYSEFEQGQSSAIEFMFENITITSHEHDFLQRSLMYDAYKEWCSAMGRKPFSCRKFFEEIANRYEHDGLDVPLNSTYIHSIKRTLRVMTGVIITKDEGAWINEKSNSLNFKV